MNFIADEGLDKTLVMLLRASGHDVFYFTEEAQSTDDETILDFANKEIEFYSPEIKTSAN